MRVSIQLEVPWSNAAVLRLCSCDGCITCAQPKTPSPKIMSELWRTLAAVYTACVRAVVFTDTRNCSFVGAQLDSSCSRPPRILLSAPPASEQATPRQHNLRIDRESLESIPVSNRKRRLLGERGQLERNLPQLHV